MVNNIKKYEFSGRATPRDNQALATLCGVLNDLAVCYPSTELRLVLEATQLPVVVSGNAVPKV
jgi:hypothetical protein